MSLADDIDTLRAMKPLTAATDNLAIGKLGMIAAEAGSPARQDVGDYIDRGLILLRLLNEAGFDVIRKQNVEGNGR